MARVDRWAEDDAPEAVHWMRVRRVQELHFAAGDVYQANLSRRLARCTSTVVLDPSGAWSIAALRAREPRAVRGPAGWYHFEGAP